MTGNPTAFDLQHEKTIRPADNKVNFAKALVLVPRQVERMHGKPAVLPGAGKCRAQLIKQVQFRPAAGTKGLSRNHAHDAPLALASIARAPASFWRALAWLLSGAGGHCPN